MPYTPGKLREYARAQMIARVGEAGEQIAALMIEKVSIPGPPRSKGGQPPRIDTTRKEGKHLYESILSVVDVGPKHAAARIGTNVAYGKYLDEGTSIMAARPWCLSTLKENRALLLRALGGG